MNLPPGLDDRKIKRFYQAKFEEQAILEIQRMVKDIPKMASEYNKSQTTCQGSPATEKRLHAASSKLQQYAGHHSNKTHYHAWAPTKSKSAADVKSRVKVGTATSRDIPGDTVGSAGAPLLPPRISNLRRTSLTGSLPDLNNADERDLHEDLLLLSPASIKRPPLPHGSEQFEKVLEEQKEESVTLASHEMIPKLSLKDLRHDANNGITTPRQKFRSKTAEALYFTKFGQCFPKYWTKIQGKMSREQGGGSHDCLHLPSVEKTNNGKHVTWGEVNICVPQGRMHKSTPSSPCLLRKPDSRRISMKFPFNPESGSLDGTPSSHDSSSPDRSHTGSPSRSPTGSLRASLDRLPRRRADSPMVSPRMLRRRQTPHAALGRTLSHD